MRIKGLVPRTRSFLRVQYVPRIASSVRIASSSLLVDTFSYGTPDKPGRYPTKFYTRSLYPRPHPLSLYVLAIFVKKMCPFHVPSIQKGTPFIYLQNDFYLTFHLSKLLKYLDESAIRCVCLSYFERPLNTQNGSFSKPFLIDTSIHDLIYLWPEKGTLFR